jgi:hypothetical protein
MTEPIGPMLKIKDKATAFEVERLLQLAQMKIVSDRLDWSSIQPYIERIIANNLLYLVGRESGPVLQIENCGLLGDGLSVTTSPPSGSPGYCLTLTNTSTSGSSLINLDNAATTFWDILGTDYCWYVTSDGHATFPGISFGSAVGKTISSDSITIDTNISHVEVDTEGGASTDDLDYILGGSDDGQLLILRSTDDSRDISVTNAGNIVPASSPRVLDNVRDKLLLIRDSDSSRWCEIAFSSNGT